MASNVSRTTNAQNVTFLDLPSELQAKIVCHTDESDWTNLYLTCTKLKAVMDESQPLIIEERQKQRKLLNATLCSQINETFQNPSSPAALVAPSADAVNTLLTLFGRCRSPEVKMKVFSDVLQATNSSDDIARQFYNALPEGKEGVEASRSAFRHQLGETNGRNTVIGGVEQGIGFADFVINNAPRGFLAIHAALDLCSELYKNNTEAASDSIRQWIHLKNP